ncbi:RNA polymerase sigma factor [Cyclobacterium qasimii]|uniref:RNA polymerase ECF-type sigma factor n=2 Tax=Cyclobacterium qasimii TaxID=1350429 RepID=S7X628_9BACT|nr:sigma-70 family RNA polymerase sigma factor [Cyclobacterium qasimii]EPR71528.1 RNA polymerase ECF-type sigma factor [Cyclobacterium qasimii M12-11B]GEO20243.1 DNA-directed RNA polymerase sigma-70 factor [Cyclobacterium qasimii]
MNNADILLLKGMAKGNVKAFEAIYNKYWDLLVRQAYAKLGDSSEAEDLVQDIFLTIWNNRKELTVQKNLKVYLLTAVKYKVYKVIYKRKELCDISLIDEVLVQSEVPRILEFEELYEKIEVAIDKLPAGQKETFKLSRYQQLSTKEIAAQLQIAPQTVHNKIHLSLLFIRAEIKNYLCG